MVASSILAGGACNIEDLADPLVPPVIRNGLVPCNGAETAVRQGDSAAEVAAAPVEPARAPAHRVQLARALADAVVGAIEAGDAKGARVAVGMLEQFVTGIMGGK